MILEIFLAARLLVSDPEVGYERWSPGVLAAGRVDSQYASLEVEGYLSRSRKTVGGGWGDGVRADVLLIYKRFSLGGGAVRFAQHHDKQGEAVAYISPEAVVELRPRSDSRYEPTLQVRYEFPDHSVHETRSTTVELRWKYMRLGVRDTRFTQDRKDTHGTQGYVLVGWSSK